MKKSVFLFGILIVLIFSVTGCESETEEKSPVDTVQAQGDDEVVEKEVVDDSDVFGGSNNDDSGNISDEDSGSSVTCGNGVVDQGEECDGAPADCEALSSMYGYGQAPCKADCTADVSECPQKTEGARPYGYLYINYSTDYIYDYEKFSSKGVSYLNEHNGVSMNVAFSGKIGYDTNNQQEFGGSLSASVEVASFKVVEDIGTHIYVTQYFFDQNDNMISRRAMLRLKDSLVAGENYAMCPDKSFFQLVETNSDGSLKCMLALALNETDPVLQVKTATNLSASEGGQLSVEGENIVLYHPADTPDGDLTKYFPACTDAPK